MDQEWPWLEERPVFTTGRERGLRVTRVPWGVDLAPLRPRFVGLVVASAVGTGLTIAGGGLVAATQAAGLGPVGWWWLALAVPALLLTVYLYAGVHVEGTELIMRRSAHALVVCAGLLGGAAIGLGLLAVWWPQGAGDTSSGPGGPADVGSGQLWNAGALGAAAPVAAAACLLVTLLAVRGVRHARSDVRRILRLRTSGARHPGVVAGLPDPGRWADGGDVPVRYEDDGGPRTIRVRLNSTASRIVVRGTAVIVLTDDDGDLLVELDPDRPVTYLADHRAYDRPSGGEGGS